LECLERTLQAYQEIPQRGYKCVFQNLYPVITEQEIFKVMKTVTMLSIQFLGCDQQIEACLVSIFKEQPLYLGRSYFES
jgi:hypothetical protein